MNIFYLHSCPRTAARYHCDKHVVKMVLEYAQLLCTAHHCSPIPTLPAPSLYKPTHRNHPSAIWVRQSPAHYRWLYALLTALLEEYTHRYSRIHSTTRLLPLLATLPHASSFTQLHFDQPPQAMPPAYHSTTSSIKAYRRYYKNDKIHFAKYTKRTIPHWLTSLH